jgi:hypothetical protein
VNFPDILLVDKVTPDKEVSRKSFRHIFNPIKSIDGRDSFDATPDALDHTAISEYLTGTGACGGPLVIGNNSTTRSDLRLFKSANNATIKR